jgi:iron complex transport system ATP-binding protein
MTLQSVLAASSISVSIDNTPILRDVSFEVSRGEWVGLIGPNGSGKSTLLRTISGLLRYSGSLEMDGREVRQWKARPLAQRVAFMQQTANLVFDLTVDDLVLLGRSPHHGWFGEFTSDDRDRVSEALLKVDASHLSERSVLTLSGGELQRVLLAQALVQETPLLLLDEPTTHLDIHHQFEFLRLIENLVTSGKTVIAVFHDLAMAGRYASRLLAMNGGRMVADGSPPAVLTQQILEDVFRMRAEIDLSESWPRITYHSSAGVNPVITPTE